MARKKDPERGGGSADQLLDALKPVIEGLVATFGSNCEIVLHDYRRPETSVVAIAGSVTSRHVGGAMSEIGLELLAQGDAAEDKLNYITRTAEGRTIKSSTMLLRHSGRVVGALCVNLDITELRLAIATMTDLIGEPETTATTTTLFSNDIRDVIVTVIGQEEERLGRPLAHDTRQGRLEVVKALESRGVFRMPRAANVVAEHLGVSRATVYADLNIIRGFPAQEDASHRGRNA
ncbi:helix-turn-helix transcriptional regulator [Streptomyces sp. 8N616]|uniref:helix-turn-helix transcriptional regulator n=1 Tax=Streptomyces sp. 8N616 TaxID=3457414 RepID=UPI003FD6A47F